MNYKERMRKAVECPQFGNIDYGEWGALNLNQRKDIKRLLDEMDRADEYIKNLYFKNENLQSKIDKAIEILGQYKHLSSPTEEQAKEQEEIVSNAYDILISMNKLEQRCEGVRKVLEDFNIMYVYQYNTKTNIKICKTKYNIEITNRYITVSYKTKHYYNFLPSFTGITEFRKFIEENGTNFMLLESKGEQ